MIISDLNEQRIRALAISPPSDIVLDVARAVGTAGLEEARASLARRVGAIAPAGTDAAFGLPGTVATGGKADARAAGATGEADTYKRFEAVVLQTFVQAMMPKDAEQVYGKGLAGDMWKSMMAGRIADVMAERGGIGIADTLVAAHYRDGEDKVAVGALSGGPEKAGLDTQKLLSAALVQELQRKAAQSLDTTEAAAISAGGQS